MKKAIVLSAVLVLVSSPSFAAAYNSKQACEFRTHSACTQEGTQWVASSTPTTTPAPTPTTAPATTTAAAPAAPAATTTQSAPAKSGWFGFGKGSTGAESSATAPGKTASKPTDPRQVAKGKVYGSQGSCQGETGGACQATDCSTHVGGVCEGNKGTVWSYVH